MEISPQFEGVMRGTGLGNDPVHTTAEQNDYDARSELLMWHPEQSGLVVHDLDSHRGQGWYMEFPRSLAQNAQHLSEEDTHKLLDHVEGSPNRKHNNHLVASGTFLDVDGGRYGRYVPKTNEESIKDLVRERTPHQSVIDRLDGVWAAPMAESDNYW